MAQSSKTYSGKNLAEWPDAKLLEALKELVNVRDDAGANRFLRRYPAFLAFSFGTITQDSLSELKDAEIIDPEIKIEHASQVKELSGRIQSIWRGLPEAMEFLFLFLVIDDAGDALRVSEVSAWQHQPRIIGPPHLAELPPAKRRAAIMSAILEGRKDDVIEQIMEMIPARELRKRLRPDWTRHGRFIYTPTTPMQKALYLLWVKSSLAKVCKNPSCAAPFFIARRIQQQYCGDDCATPFRLEAKLKWWNSTGKERREKKIAKRKTRRA
ncbi:MAG TPA: hypothetical protein VGR55_00595 [Candidatus Acidoferrum sp.]|nr:hypothetical protein [Candidatus Acidoferrum sp.]